MLKTLLLFAIGICCIFLNQAYGSEEGYTGNLKNIVKTFPADSEGYCKEISGKQISYSNWRAKKFPALIARNTRSIEWETAPLPANWKGSEAVFIWESGLDGNLDDAPFTLEINETKKIKFKTPSKWSWTSENSSGCKLTFVGLSKDQYKDVFGYMLLSIPKELLTPDKPVKLKIVGEAASPPGWVIIFKDPNALKSLKNQKIHIDVMINWEGLSIQVFALPTWGGRKIDIILNEEKIGQLHLTAGTGFASGKFFLKKQLTKKKNIITFKHQNKVVGRKIVTNAKLIKEFLEQQLTSKSFIFNKGKTPKITWQQPGVVKGLIGGYPLKTTYYDYKWQKVEKLDKAGRYGAVLTTRDRNDFQVRRFVTLYATPEEWGEQTEVLDIQSRPDKITGIPENIWQNNRKYFDEYYGRYMLINMPKSEMGAEILAGLSEIKKNMPKYRKNPFNRNRQWWLTLKRKLFKVETCYPAFNRPLKLDKQTGIELRTGKPENVGYTKENIDTIRQICKEWTEKGGEPCTALIAKNGVVVFHEAFGKFKESPMTLDRQLWIASITKFITGCLMMEFVDQGLIGLDDPVEKYLPEMKNNLPLKITIRDLFVHTSGLWGHGIWGADWNSNLENCVAHYLPNFELRKRMKYNGMGYAVVGKVMEMVSGKAIPYMFQENLLLPLGANNTKIEGTSGDSMSVCIDIARLGQMILNKGSYGNYLFFSEKTLDKMLPTKIKLTSGKEITWGIGCNNYKFKKLNLLGHPAASGTIFRVNLKNNIVVVMCRSRIGKNYNTYRDKFLSACFASFIKSDR